MALAGVVGLVALHLRDPHVGGSWGWCPFHAITGWWCPGCGGLRALHDLTDLDVAAAVSANVLAVVAAVALAVAWVGWVRGRWTGARDRDRLLVLSPIANRTVLAVMVVFTIVRNLPPGAGLAP